ncbi:DNA ligase D [Herbaspirillum rubrisubalbicans]
MVAGVKLTHPGKILFPDTGLTKLELARYYQSVAPWILPELKQRPLSLVRCPDGQAGKCFFQKHSGQGMPEAIDTIQVPEGEGTAQYMMVNDVAGLVATVQMGVLELHAWGATGRALDQPDRVVFDLDPAPDVPWASVVEGAQLVRGLLQEIGLESYLKTSGGKGLHVMVPMRPEHDWDVVKDWAHRLAAHLARLLPERFIARMSKAARAGKIFIDYLRNAPGATTVVAYSVRARDGAPVSVPITWEELEQGVRADHFKVATMPQRLQSLAHSDPWAGFSQPRQRLTKAMLAAFDPV